MRRPPPEDINLAGGRLLTQEEAARALGKSIKTIYRMRNSGQLAYIPGSPVTIPERALVQYLEGATICRDKTRGRTSRKSQTSTRSEERRVGKECVRTRRTRWPQSPDKKKQRQTKTKETK